ncbi:hypothetical protein [Globicatella sanguinis]
MRPTQLCGGGQTKRKSFNFLLLVHSQLCGGGQTKRKLFNFYFLSTPNCTGVDKQYKIWLYNFLCGPTRNRLFIVGTH